MKTVIAITGVGLLLAGLSSAKGNSSPAKATAPPASAERPGDVERAALSKVGFLVGDWEGEGWSLSSSGQRERFWAKEFYRYRGNKDLMDMEGRFGAILPDGAMSAEQQYALGILFFDRENHEYHMWHYSSNGTAFTVKMDVDIERRTAQYTRKLAQGELGKFQVAVGEDGIWVTQLEILRPDNSWLQVMEFRMKRVK
jgi:hypothetical protein